jgi:tetratricopeptide (TPR) repeat protein
VKQYFSVLVAIFSISVCLSNSAAAAVIHGVAVDAIDGETLDVTVNNRPTRVRLSVVTAPKKPKPLAEVARLHLALLVKGKQIDVEARGLDPNGDIVGIVTLNGNDVGLQMVRDGAAFYNRAFADNLPDQTRKLYEECEDAARSEARGVWQTSVVTPLPEGETDGVESPRPAGSNDEARKLNDDAYVLIQQGNYKAALPKCRDALRLDPDLADAHKNLALIFCDTGQYQDALPEVQQAIKLKPDSPKAHNVLGKILFGLGDYAGSIQEYDRAIHLNPRYTRAYYNLGVALAQTGHPDSALTAYQRAEQLAPDDANTQLNIGVVLWRLGRKAEGRERWKKVLALHDPVAKVLAEQNLDHLRD